MDAAIFDLSPMYTFVNVALVYWAHAQTGVTQTVPMYRVKQYRKKYCCLPHDN